MLSLRSVASIMAVLGLFATTAQADGVRLNAQSVKNLFPGHYEARVKGYKVLFSAHRGGGLAGQAFGQEDHGRWFVQGRRLCIVWKQWTKGKTKCGSISRQGKWFVASSTKGQLLKFRPVSFVALDQ